jgi:hypothetical protein
MSVIVKMIVTSQPRFAIFAAPAKAEGDPCRG